MRSVIVTGGFEADFAAALLAPNLPAPARLRVPPGADLTHRFGVYRNNVVAGLVNALASRFPVVERLVGKEFFAAMARIYVAGNLPRSPLMFRYGDGFPAFIESFAPAASVPFLADIARLEFLRGEAYHAADAEPLDARKLAGLALGDLLKVRLRLHPSLRLLTSRFPVVSIWQAHRERTSAAIEIWTPQAALVIRPGSEVELHLLPPGCHDFVTALTAGANIGEAADDAAADSGFDPTQCFALLLEAHAVIGTF